MRFGQCSKVWQRPQSRPPSPSGSLLVAGAMLTVALNPMDGPTSSSHSLHVGSQVTSSSSIGITSATSTLRSGPTTKPTISSTTQGPPSYLQGKSFISLCVILTRICPNDLKRVGLFHPPSLHTIAFHASPFLIPYPFFSPLLTLSQSLRCDRR